MLAWGSELAVALVAAPPPPRGRGPDGHDVAAAAAVVERRLAGPAEDALAHASGRGGYVGIVALVVHYSRPFIYIYISALDGLARLSLLLIYIPLYRWMCVSSFAPLPKSVVPARTPFIVYIGRMLC